eukprot:TRINITY_DN27686_c0_g1_i1.p1 TRINITY_DN27686_c0_g1~~TRINITY_DN27686_c0_g1_i1.p1  ORF type:complete len:874 (-),score=134.42 TRINITY_DN27686_c0_g1_i1:60-2681(-)
MGCLDSRDRVPGASAHAAHHSSSTIVAVAAAAVGVCVAHAFAEDFSGSLPTHQLPDRGQSKRLPPLDCFVTEVQFLAACCSAKTHCEDVCRVASSASRVVAANYVADKSDAAAVLAVVTRKAAPEKVVAGAVDDECFPTCASQVELLGRCCDHLLGDCPPRVIKQGAVGSHHGGDTKGQVGRDGRSEVEEEEAEANKRLEADVAASEGVVEEVDASQWPHLADKQEAALLGAPLSAGDPCWCMDEPDGAMPLAAGRDGAHTNVDPSLARRRPRVSRWEELAVLRELADAMDRRNPHWTSMKDSDIEHLRHCVLCSAREEPQSRMRPPAEEMLELHGRQLFVDDYLIETAKDVVRFLEAPQVYPQEVLGKTEEWEDDTMGFPGSVNHNGSHFLMHYSSARITPGARVRLALAVSNNGFNWRKQSLNLSFSISLGADFCVLLDELEPSPLLRYKMVYNCGDIHNHGCLATSPDGIAWRGRGFKFPMWTDTLPCLYHDHESHYELMLRREFPSPLLWRGVRGTQVLRIEANAFRRALALPNARMNPELRREWYFDRHGKLEWVRRQAYAHSRTMYEGVYLGLVHVYQWPIVSKLTVNNDFLRSITPFFRDPDAVESFDTLQVFLATSRDGTRFNFQWIYSDQPLELSMPSTAPEIATRKGGAAVTVGLVVHEVVGSEDEATTVAVTSDYKWVQAAAQLVTFGEHHWLYFTGNPTSHRHRWETRERFHLARFPRDRLSGLMMADAVGTTGGRGGDEGGSEEGVLTTRPFSWPSPATVGAIAVNVEIPKGALCRMSAIVGAVLDDAFEVPMAAFKLPQEGHEVIVQIPSASKIGSDGRGRFSEGSAVRFRFRLRGQARLYAFRLLTPAETLGKEHRGM